MTIESYGIQIGILTIRFYGILIMLGALGGAAITAYRARQQGLNPDFVWDALIWVIIGGVIGARIYHIFTPPPSMIAMGITTQYYLTHPLEAIAIWNGGLGLPGALVGGIFAMYLYARQSKTSLPMWLDLAAPGAAFGQAVGRWGNYFNQELYGAPTDLPWAIFIEPKNRLLEYMDVAYYHPTFLYESLWNLANMLVLFWIAKKAIKWFRSGDLFVCYLIFYALGRFLLEFIRLESSELAGLNANQVLMLVVFIFSIAWLVWHWRSPKAVGEPVRKVEILDNPEND